MGILDLTSQMEFNDKSSLEIWFQNHGHAHQNYATALFKITGRVLPNVNVNDDGALQDWIKAMQDGKEGEITPRLTNWLYSHSQLHGSEIEDLNDMTPVDVSTVDFRDEGQFYEWMNDHSDLHGAEDLAFGVIS